MAYCRWHNTDWYIYWVATPKYKKNEQKLAIWSVHAQEEQDKAKFYYLEVKAMLSKPNLLEKIPGWDKTEDHETPVRCMKEWMEDIEEKYSAKH